MALPALLVGATAAAEAPSSAAVPLPLVGSSQHHELAGHFALLRDASGRMTLDEVLQQGPQAMTPLRGPVSLGFTRDAVWLRFVVNRPDESQPDHWWLALNQPLLEQADLYVVEGDGRQSEVARRRSPTQEVAETFAGRHPLFDLTMPTPGVRTYYLRLQTQASMSLTAALWQPGALAENQSEEAFLWGCLFGAYALIILFYLAFWVWTGELLHLSYVLYVTFNFLAALFSGGWPRQLWPELGMDTYLMLLGLWITVPVFVGSWFSALLLGIHKRWPRTVRAILGALALIAITAAALILMGHYQRVVPLIQVLSITMIGCLVFAALYLGLRGERAAWLLLGAFSFFYAGLAWRYLRNIGLVELNFWSDNSYQLGAFVHMLVMSVGIFSRYGNLRRESRQVQARVEAEAALRAHQRDFMSMVSHEFRTPLSIITATTHNMLNDPQLAPGVRERVLKVVRANDRMANLMENYLANERLLDQAHPDLTACDVREVCQAACDDLDFLEGPAPVLSGPEGVFVNGDEDLLRIALANLLGNARRHSPPGAPVEMEVRVSANQARITVRDQGQGVPPDDAEHIFHRFFRGRNALASQGVGLGLYLVRVIAERHGGAVTTRNLAPRGCEFVLSLPLATPPASSGPTHAGSGQKRPPVPT